MSLLTLNYSNYFFLSIQATFAFLNKKRLLNVPDSSFDHFRSCGTSKS